METKMKTGEPLSRVKIWSRYWLICSQLGALAAAVFVFILVEQGVFAYFGVFVAAVSFIVLCGSYVVPLGFGVGAWFVFGREKYLAASILSLLSILVSWIISIKLGYFFIKLIVD